MALISLNRDLRRDITWLSKKKRTTRFIDKPLFLQVTKDHDVILEKIRTWADDLKALRRQNRSPTSDEIDRTRLLANDIEAIHVRYTRLIGPLQANVRRIFIVELNIYRRLKVKKEIIVAVGALLLAIASGFCARKIQAASAPDDPSLLAIVMSIAALLLTGISTIAWVTVGRLAFDWIMKKRT